MPHDFLIPAQTLLSNVNKLIVEENRKQTPVAAKNEMIKVLIVARNAFIVTEKKYRNLFTTKQIAELSPLLTLLEAKTSEFLRLIDEAQTAITHFAKDVKEEDSTPVLEQIFNARVLKKDEETNSQSSSDSESNEDTESDAGLDFSEKALALFQDNALFGAQLMEVKKKQEELEQRWYLFFETMNNCDIEKLEVAHKALKRISKTLINALYEIQANNAMPQDDLGMILAYKKLAKGPMQLHNDFQAGISSADEMIEGLAQQIGCDEPILTNEEIPTSPTDSTASVSSCSSSFFSSPRSCSSSANDEVSESELDETAEPPRKCARR